jgi:hypothetical protein
LIHQDAWFHLGKFDKGIATTYSLKKVVESMLYPFRNVMINGQELETRDGFGIWDVNSLDIKATSEVEFLLMETRCNTNQKK